MKKKFIRILSALVAILTVSAMMTTLAGCNKENPEDPRKQNNDSTSPYVYDKDGNTTPAPSDNDDTGWFSVEVLAKFAASALTQPEDTEVVSKTSPETIILKGDKASFIITTNYVYSAIRSSGAKLYTPEFTVNDDGTLTVTSLEEGYVLDENSLYPKGDLTDVLFVYKVSKKSLYECRISAEKSESGEELVCISFSDRSSDYKDLI